MKGSLPTLRTKKILITGDTDLEAKKSVETNLVTFLLTYYLSPNSTKNSLLKLPSIYFLYPVNFSQIYYLFV